MAVSPALLEEAKVGYHANYLMGLDRATPIWDRVSTRVPSTTKVESYPFLHAFPKMAEWVGARMFEEMKASDYRLTNRKFQTSVKVPREELEDDRISLYNPSMQMMGESAAYWPDELVTDTIVAGGTSLCYDGQYFFDTDHPVDPFDAGKGVQANLFTSKALTEANYAEVLSKMRVLKDASGKVIRVFSSGIILMVPAALEKTARTIVEAVSISQNNGASSSASTQTNVYRGSAAVLVNPLLDASSTSTWYLLDASKPVKPFVFQERIAPEFQMVTGDGDEHVIKHDEYLCGVRARGAAGYGLWQLAAKCTA